MARTSARRRLPFPPRTCTAPDFAPLAAVPIEHWRALAERAIEPNGYYLPAWEIAVNASARGRTGVSALSAWRDGSQCRTGSMRHR